MTLAREEKAKTKSTPNTSQNAEGFLLYNTLGLWVHQALQKHNSEQQLLLSPFSPKKKTPTKHTPKETAILHVSKIRTIPNGATPEKHVQR